MSHTMTRIFTHGSAALALALLATACVAPGYYDGYSGGYYSGYSGGYYGVPYGRIVTGAYYGPYASPYYGQGYGPAWNGFGGTVIYAPGYGRDHDDRYRGPIGGHFENRAGDRWRGAPFHQDADHGDRREGTGPAHGWAPRTAFHHPGAGAGGFHPHLGPQGGGARGGHWHRH